ncbi:F-box domain-containing protein [Heracleum sosnowskyi]|uniref:F-box domain-containing protein n=1 Tax=Heracleum sosnowskyi TaxID=360622 RepID=A0AAD8IK99_9APIA|nr:F-box domain-containing protein [Heracleum sosnowskyi]
MGSCLQKTAERRSLDRPEDHKIQLCWEISSCNKKNMRSFSELPKEITLEIFSRLPIPSLLICKLVCKRWNTAIAEPVLATMQLANAADQSLCLVLHSEFPKFVLYNVFVNDLGCPCKEWKRLKLPFRQTLSRFEVVGSCNGLLCVSHYELDDPVLIYNHLTWDYKQLPNKGGEHLKGNVYRCVFGFGFDPKTMVYKVIKIVHYAGSSSEVLDVNRKPDVYVVTLGSEEWTYKGQTHYQLTGSSSEAIVNGKFHWLTHYNFLEAGKCQDIISFDLSTEIFQELPRPDFEGLMKHTCHLVTLKGVLSAVISYDDGTHEIWKMKDYNVKDSWSRECVIGKYVPRIFITFGMFNSYPGRGSIDGYRKHKFQVICILSNGEILLLYENQALVSYNAETGKFKDLKIKGQRFEYLLTLHTGSIISVNAAFDMHG